jgi:predicted subunit of tRNA(5-methylaminomethyl-2-thiouridylate) methyltransferase
MKEIPNVAVLRRLSWHYISPEIAKSCRHDRGRDETILRWLLHSTTRTTRSVVPAHQQTHGE